MGFLAGEAYLANQESNKESGRSTRTSRKAVTKKNSGGKKGGTLGPRKRAGTLRPTRKLTRRKRVSD